MISMGKFCHVCDTFIQKGYVEIALALHSDIFIQLARALTGTALVTSFVCVW